jgi:excisionase family DNA binding protein
MEEILTVKEVAKILRVSRQKVSELIRKKKLKATEVDYQYRVKKDWLEEYIKDCMV